MSPVPQAEGGCFQVVDPLHDMQSPLHERMMGLDRDLREGAVVPPTVCVQLGSEGD